MPLTPRTYDFKQGTYGIAKHEVGHWLAAFTLGWGPREIEIKVPFHAKGHFGSTSASFKTSLTEIESVRRYARGRVKILYSGAYAEHFDGKEFDTEAILADFAPDGGAYSDYWKAEEIYFFYYNCLENPKGWEAEFSPIISDVQMMIQKHYDFIHKVAKHLSEEASYPGQKITMSAAILEDMFKNSEMDFSEI
ncbi:TPA: hypothetical protein ACGZ2B_001988 [Citrobacter freundii]